MAPGSRSLQSDLELILQIRHTWRGPSGPFRLLPFGPGPDPPAERHPSIVSFHLHTPSVELGTPPECGLDPRLDVPGRHAGLDGDEVAHALHPCQVADRPLGGR